MGGVGRVLGCLLLLAILVAPNAGSARNADTRRANTCTPPGCAERIVIRTYDLRITGAVTTTFTQDGVTSAIKWTETYRRVRISFKQTTLRVNNPRQRTIVRFSVEQLNRTKSNAYGAGGEIVETASVRAADCTGTTRSSSPARVNLGYNDYPPHLSLSTYRDRSNLPPCRGESWSPEAVLVKRPGGMTAGFAGATDIQWTYKARQNLGRLGFPMNQLFAGKPLTISASGTSFENYPSQGWVRAVFTPRT